MTMSIDHIISAFVASCFALTSTVLVCLKLGFPLIAMFYLNLERKWLNHQVLADVLDVWHFL